VALSYSTTGDGPVRVLAAHSWPASSVTFASMSPYLDTDETTWVFPDFRGYGSSADLTGRFSIEEMAHDLLEVADALGWDTFHLVGHSMGGQAAQLLSSIPETRDRILTLSLVSAVPSRGYPLDAESETFFAAASREPAVMEQVATALTGGRLGPGFAKYLASLSETTATAATLQRYLRAWSREDVSGQVGGYTRPVLLLTGEFDPVLGADIAAEQIVPQFADVRQAVVAAAGHFPPVEAPARTAALLSAHILGRPADAALDR
jgi:pimeloyl-ACP methyl ester carboxylesterase